MDIKKKLKEIFENDPLNLLEIKAPVSQAKNKDERLVASFAEINDFFEKNSREPEQGGGIQEHQLFSRLKGIREDKEKIEMLKKYDKFKLLNELEKLESIEDVFNSDPLGLLSEDEDIFVLKNVSHPSQRESTDFVARRKKCEDFEKYENIFRECHADLKAGRRELVKFNENHIVEGSFFVLSGVLLFVEKISEIKFDKFGKKDGRTRIIFENGTESNMLFRSLSKGIYESGSSVSQNKDEVHEKFQEYFGEISEEDKELGFIYILKSKSENPKIREIKNLYKIGYSVTPVEERIKNSVNEVTYLMSEVRIVMTFKCYNVNPQKFENLLHNFFGKSCLNIDIFDKNGVRHTPREWFVAPLSIIERAVHLIVSGEIIKYKYDPEFEEIVGK